MTPRTSLRKPALTWHRVLVVIGLLAGVTPGFAAAQRPLNLDFELPSVAYPDRPWGWTLGWSAFAGGPAAEFVRDTARLSGSHSLRITASDTMSGAPARGMVLQLPGTSGHGRTLRLTGHLRTRNLAGRALVLLEAWGDRVVLAGDTASVPASSARWSPFDLRITVPRDPSIHSLVITTAVQGAGSAWFDQFALEIDGEPVTSGSPAAPAGSRAAPAGTSAPTGVRAASSPDRTASTTCSSALRRRSATQRGFSRVG